MPKVLPTPGPVYWPPDEGTIGVVGVAPWATLEFCRAVYSLVPAEKDWHYPRILVDANSKIPSRGRHLQLGEVDPSPLIRLTIEELARQGATVAVVPCNTAHILYDRWGVGTSIPALNIVEVTAAQVARRGVARVAVLASQSIDADGLYRRAIERHGVEVVPPGASTQEEINAVIAHVKVTGGASAEARDALQRVLAAAKAHGAELAVLGCTELGLVRAALGDAPPLPTVDSNEALARASLRSIGLLDGDG